MRALIALSVLASLAGCGSQETQTAKGSSVSEVLPGSASDAMLPYDTATSAPPLAPNQGYTSSDSSKEPASAPRPSAPATERAPEPEAS